MAATRIGNEATPLVVVRGNSGSGKSALAAAIRAARPRGVAILGHDVLRRQILHVPDRPGALSVAYLDLSARFALDHGLHVVIEGILHEEIYGDVLRRLLDDHVGVTCCYRYDFPFEKTVRRHVTKGATAQEFGEAEMRSWWRDQDPLHGVLSGSSARTRRWRTRCIWSCPTVGGSTARAPRDDREVSLQVAGQFQARSCWRRRSSSGPDGSARFSSASNRIAV